MECGCDKCRELCIIYKIDSPRQLDKTIRVVRQNLQDSTINESSYWPEGKIKSCNTPFHEIKEGAPYSEDIYIYYFRCSACQQLFELVCNTYHGSGGQWKPIRNNDF